MATVSHDGGIDWQAVGQALERDGFAVLPRLLDADACAAAAGLWDAADFRREVVMARHGYGQGVYRYFAEPLPERVAALRRDLYRPLARLANRWVEPLRLPAAFPPTLEGLLRRCRAAGQRRPTPLLLKYGAGDYNCLHQDLYGEVFFPLQAAVLLSAPGRDFEGGEFVLVENRPRRQSVASVVPLERGDAVVFATRERPVAGARGTYRAQLRHGVSRIRRGERLTLGLIFHDAA